MIVPTWIKLSAALALLAAYGAWCYHVGAKSTEAAHNEQLIEAWQSAERLSTKLSAADRKLAEAQALIMQGVAVEVTKREVIYRDRIKDPAVRGCISQSGLLELIDAANGIDSTKH